MCGITGFISKDRDARVEPRERLLGRMCDSIKHRGPDEEGILVRGRAALGMRRLSIIDIRTGQQPILNGSGDLAIIFNGEIYNYRELGAELASRGYQFKTNSDTETILHAYEEFGSDCLARLEGMFAFAIWDHKKESLFVARDRLGKKPLYYSLNRNGEFIFGSELKTLLTFGIDVEVEPRALDAYLSFGYVPEEFCILQNVQKLAPGHFLKFENGVVSSYRYWDLDRDGTEDRTEKEWAKAVREKLRDAVRKRLISEVPLGAFLSGGVDSSTIVALMAETSVEPVKTFSIGFDDESFDELRYARLVAGRYATEHHEFKVTQEAFDEVDEIVGCFDEPFADQSALPTFILSKLAREHVTVVLSGDGGDELFAGYDRYAIEQRRSGFGRVPRLIREQLFRRAAGAMPHGSPGKNFLYNVSLDALDRYIDNISAVNLQGKQLLYAADFADALNGGGSAANRLYRRFGEYFPEGRESIDRLLYMDTKTYLPGDILNKVDRMTMANSLEARSPFLDHELVELAFRIPLDLKMRCGEGKYILKKAMSGIVPDEILYREKQGFGVPLGRWMNNRLGDRIREDLTSERAVNRGYFSAEHIKRLLSEHASGRRDHSHQLWILWMLELWFRRYSDRGGGIETQ